MTRRFRLALLALAAALLATTAGSAPRPPNLPTPAPVLYYLNNAALLKPGTAAKLQKLGVTDVSLILTDNQLKVYVPYITPEERDAYRAEVARRCAAYAAAAKPLRWHVAIRAHSDSSLEKSKAPLSATGWRDNTIWDWWIPNLAVIAEEVKRAGGAGVVFDDEPYISQNAPWPASSADAKTLVPKRARQFLAAWKGLQLRHCAPYSRVQKLLGWGAFWRTVHADQPAAVYLAEETYTSPHQPYQVLRWRDQFRVVLGAKARICFGLSPTQPKYAGDRQRQQFIRQATPGAGVWLYSFPHSPLEPLTEDAKSAPVVVAVRAIVGGK